MAVRRLFRSCLAWPRKESSAPAPREMSAFNLRIPLPEDGSAAVKTWSVPPLNTIAFFPTGFSPHTVHGLFERHSTVQEAITATCHFMHDYFQVTNLCAGFVPASLALTQ